MGTLFKSISIGRFALALVLASFLWGYIQLTQFPETSATFPSVPLTVIKPPNGLIVRSQIPNHVSVDVSGASDTIHGLNIENINAKLDLSKYTGPSTVNVPVKVNPVDGVTFISHPETVAVQIEQEISKTLDISINLKGLPPDYIKVGQPTLGTDKVTLSGPKSVVDQVVSATVAIDISSATTEIDSQQKISLLDKNGLIVTDDQLVTDPATVTVKVPIQSQFNSRPVPVEVQTTGTPAPGYVVSAATSDPTLVTIFGLPDAVSKIKTVKTRPIDISGASRIVTATAQLEVPGGVATSIDNVRVTLTFTQLTDARVLIVPLEFQNLPSGYSVTPATIPVSVTLSGPLNILQQVQINDIHAFVDFTGKPDGKLDNLPVQLDVPSSVQAKVEPTSVTLTLLLPPTPTPLPTATPRPLPTYTPIPLPTSTHTPLPPTPTISSPTPAAGAASNSAATATGRAPTSTPKPTPAAVVEPAIPIEPTVLSPTVAASVPVSQAQPVATPTATSNHSPTPTVAVVVTITQFLTSPVLNPPTAPPTVLLTQAAKTVVTVEAYLDDYPSILRRYRHV